MKKTIYISGLIIINLLLFGCLFKVNHWPGAGIMFTISIVALIFWFLPVALINNFKGRTFQDKKWVYIATFITFFIVFLGALFKVQHWPGASLLMLIGVPLPFLLFLPVYLYHQSREEKASASHFTAIILGLTFIGVYSVLLAINVSKDVLDKGISLIKTNEKVIDFYENNKNDLLADVADSNSDIEQLNSKTLEIIKLIHKAEFQLLYYSGNDNLTEDLGSKDFNFHNLKNVESASSMYILHWQDSALIGKIKNKIADLEFYIMTLDIDKNLAKTVDKMIYLEDDPEYYLRNWQIREFSSDYMIYALESLSRWEKNILFIENEVITNILKKP